MRPVAVSTAAARSVCCRPDVPVPAGGVVLRRQEAMCSADVVLQRKSGLRRPIGRVRLRS